MDIFLLGGVELRVNGERAGLRGRLDRLVLASFAIQPGVPVSLGVLRSRLWGSHPPSKPTASLHPYLSRVRTILRSLSDEVEGPMLVPGTQTYVLRVDPQIVDLRRYQLRMGEACGAAARGEDERALALFRQAEDLWQRGEPLAGLPGRWAAGVQAELAEKHRTLTVARIASELRLARYADAVGSVVRLLEQAPEDETLIGHLMIAYHGQGRRARALDTYQDLRRRLRVRHHTEPGGWLQRIYRAIRDNVPPHELIPAGPPTPRPAAASRRNHLPLHASLVGRHDQMRTLLSAFHSARMREESGAVVTIEAIHGMAGVGKSTLAFHLAGQLEDRFPDGVLYVDLQANSMTGEPLLPAVALARLLQQLQVPAVEVPQDLAGTVALWRTVMPERRAVVVLDNATGPDQVRPLLPSRSSSLVIITSRHRLSGLPGARPLTLPVMPPTEAIELFRHVADAERSTPTEQVAGVVRSVGYLPLAIELVASRFDSHPAWTLADLSERLGRTEGRLGEIRDGSREIIRAFEFSYRALTDEQQTVFRLLGLHVGPEFSLHAAAALTGLPAGVIERALEDLGNCHLVQEPRSHRWRLHDLLAEYARTLVSGESARRERHLALRRLIDFYLYTADQADRRLYPHRSRIEIDVEHVPPSRPVWREEREIVAWLSEERGTILALVQYLAGRGEPRTAALLAHVIAGFLDAERHWVEVGPAFREVVGYWRGSGDRLAEAKALVDLCLCDFRAGHSDEAEAAARRAVELAREAGDQECEAEALRWLSANISNTRGAQEALYLQLQAMDLLISAGDRGRLSRLLNGTGITLSQLGDIHTAVGCYESALRCSEEMGDRRHSGQLLNNLGDAYTRGGETESARAAYEQALDIAVAVGNRSDQATIRGNLADILRDQGELEKARDIFRDNAETFRSLGEVQNESAAVNSLGTTLRMAGRHAEALERHLRALRLARSIGAAVEEAQALRELGVVEHQMGRAAEAVGHLEEALAIARRVQVAGEERCILDCIAAVGSGSGFNSEAAG